MQTQAAKLLSLPELLTRLGHQPTRVSGQKLWYRSPLHPERTASFCVEPGRQVAWVFADHGLNVKGTILDFAMHHEHCSLSQALGWLSQVFADPPPAAAAPAPQPPDASSLQLNRVQPLQHPGLLAYLHDRRIPFGLARRYLSELHYFNSGQPRFALGWPTDPGGWCLRAPHFKACLSPAGITVVGKPGQRLAVFEGMFDFLSALAYYQTEIPQGQVVILNSVAHLHLAVALIAAGSAQSIRLYLDHDRAGRQATQHLLTFNHTLDCSTLFQPAKDFAQWYETRLKRTQSLSFPQ